MNQTHRPVRPEQYRTITLVNANYKFLSLIFANRLSPWIRELHLTQLCGVQENNILESYLPYERQLLKLNSPTHLLTLYRSILIRHLTTLPTPNCSRKSSPTVSASASNSDSKLYMEMQRLQPKRTAIYPVSAHTMFGAPRMPNQYALFHAVSKVGYDCLT
jgi:hypothetical protein